MIMQGIFIYIRGRFTRPMIGYLLNNCMKKIFLFITALYANVLLHAQPGALDLSFKGTGAGDHVRGSVVQPDGKLIIAGDFLFYNDSAVNHVVRVLDNGGVDTSFYLGSGTDAKVYALALQSDGKIIIGGDFLTYNGTTTNHLARLNANGTLDTSFHTGSGTDYQIKAIYLQPDEKILIGGNFLQYNGSACNRLIRIDTNGVLDTSFAPGTGANGTIECITLQPDGKILVGGSFTNFNGTLDIRIARLNSNGSIDSTFNQGFGGTNSTVTSIAIQYDTNVVIGGNFTAYNLQNFNHIVRLSPNGDPNNNFFEGVAANSTVQVIKVDKNNYIYIGGSFSSYDGTPVNRMARLTPQGFLDTTFNIQGTGSSGDVSTISFQPDGKIVIGGDFLLYNDISQHRLARLYNCLTPQPDSIYGLDYALCSGTKQTYFINPISGAVRYEWTLPNGWAGSSDSASIIATSNGTGGVISVRAFTDSCGYSYVTTRNITTIQPANVPICLVTVDTASTHNIVIWEKPLSNLIDSFFIYRETSTGVYTKIAVVPYDSLSEYHDYGANPNTTSYRYRLSVLDTCGAESELSPYHSTIHLQNLGSGNFQWTFYRIEGQVNPVISFNVYRDNNSTGNFFPIGNVPGSNSTFTDVTFNSFNNSEYVVDADWNISCSPSRVVNTTRSNKRPKNAIEFISIGQETSIASTINVYPNPAKGLCYIQLPEGMKANQLQMLNSLGQIVHQQTESMERINTAQLKSGLYTIILETNYGKAAKKLIVE